MLLICKKSKEPLSKTALSVAAGVNHNSIQKWRSAYISGGIENCWNLTEGDLSLP